ncbi:uncharacterized protein K460DRAFT_45326 [Cucurbitaria berberidis CBS 394.84]|uniref:Uncharacterized protein n=1 Tax=Cucurbitaria berberidis CBS 394.84 TaxID=1168544 RepID=A0A9P4LEG1_9PLEO|nr:uncharacterized protein K460DRAFT_45326 [Cucurbitaria berberidis CBS 394.84]KAF1852005.1 hypothetical protein K460DRAFT_45326 [Cucurbitaria berberidis CBS 394.84]
MLPMLCGCTGNCCISRSRFLTRHSLLTSRTWPQLTALVHNHITTRSANMLDGNSDSNAKRRIDYSEQPKHHLQSALRNPHLHTPSALPHYTGGTDTTTILTAKPGTEDSYKASIPTPTRAEPQPQPKQYAVPHCTAHSTVQAMIKYSTLI